MSVIPTKEDVLTHVQTMLDHLSVVAEMDTLLQAMDTHAMVICTDFTIKCHYLGHSYKYLISICISSNSDVNECTTGSGGCGHICTNSAGSFQCSCNSGYNLAPDGTTCVDIDECELNTDNCQQTCVNTVGGFTCSCNSGFALNRDERTCDGKLTMLSACM